MHGKCRVLTLCNVPAVVQFHAFGACYSAMANSEAAGSSNEDDTKKACLLRNRNEKKRRDRFNNLVNELSASLPLAGKRLSKNNVLKFAIEHFRQNQLDANSENVRGEKVYGKWQPDFLTNEEFRQTVLDGLEGIVLAVEEYGKIIYVSSNVFSCLGYDEGDILKTNILDYVHMDDQRTMYSLLGTIYDNWLASNPVGVHRFSLRVRRGPLNRGPGEYVTLRCVSKIIRADNMLASSQQKEPCVVLLGRVVFFPTVNSTVLISDIKRASKFTTRLNKEWRFECVERSATLTLGYYPIELLGTCLYEYCHADDLGNLSEYHSMLLYSGVITTCCYRLLTKGQGWIWVRSRCHVSYSQLDSKPESIICITWPIKSTEFTANQQETIERDRKLFSQILEKHGGRQIPSNFFHGVQENEMSNSPALLSSPCMTSSPLPPCSSGSHLTPVQDSSLVSITDNSNGSQSASGYSAVMIPYTDSALAGMGACMDTAAVVAQSNDLPLSSDPLASSVGDLDENSLLLGEQIEMPESLSFSQWALHLHLREQYKSLTETIRQQSEQVTVIRKQLSIQKELAELSEELEVQQRLKKQNLRNTFDETRASIQQKMRELQEIHAQHIVGPT